MGRAYWSGRLSGSGFSERSQNGYIQEMPHHGERTLRTQFKLVGEWLINEQQFPF